MCVCVCLQHRISIIRLPPSSCRGNAHWSLSLAGDSRTCSLLCCPFCPHPGLTRVHFERSPRGALSCSPVSMEAPPALLGGRGQDWGSNVPCWAASASHAISCCCCSGLVPNRKGHRATAKGQRSAARLLARGSMGDAGQGQPWWGSCASSHLEQPPSKPSHCGLFAGLDSVRMGRNRPTSFMVSAIGADGLGGKLHLKAERSPALWSAFARSGGEAKGRHCGGHCQGQFYLPLLERQLYF